MLKHCLIGYPNILFSDIKSKFCTQIVTLTNKSVSQASNSLFMVGMTTEAIEKITQSW